jgi:hypothetical protein
MVRESNFADDPLRVLRGARLLAELALAPEGETLAAMRRHAPAVAGAAPERLGSEWLALLAARDAAAFRRGLELVRELGLDTVLLGGAMSDVAIEMAVRVEDADPVSRLAAIALETDEAALCGSLLRLGLGAARVDALRGACRLVRRLRGGEGREIDPVLLHDEGAAAARRAIAIVRAAGDAGLAARISERVARDGERIFSARPLLDGHAIVALTGLEPGPRVGAIRRALLVAQLRGEVGSEEEARAFVRDLGADAPS